MHIQAFCDGELIDGRAWEIERQIQEKDPMLVLTWDGKRNQWIVIRRNEDGSVTGLARWEADELPTIPSCLDLMRAGAEGRVPDAVTRIEQKEAELEAASSAKFRDAYGSVLEHALKLHHDTTQPKNVFRMVGGRRDEPDVPGAPVERDR